MNVQIIDSAGIRNFIVQGLVYPGRYHPRRNGVEEWAVVFCVGQPIPAESSRASAGALGSSLGLHADAPRPTVLIVEDDPATSNALRAILTHRGWAVSAAQTLATAMEFLDEKPDCLILDLLLPDGNGADILKAAHEQQLQSRIIVTTGASDPDALLSGAARRPWAVLRKPINLTDLLRAIQLPS